MRLSYEMLAGIYNYEIESIIADKAKRTCVITLRSAKKIQIIEDTIIVKGNGDKRVSQVRIDNKHVIFGFGSIQSFLISGQTYYADLQGPRDNKKDFRRREL